MLSLAAYLHSGDLSILFVLLAVVAFAIALCLVYVGQWIGALVAAVIGVLILLA